MACANDFRCTQIETAANCIRGWKILGAHLQFVLYQTGTKVVAIFLKHHSGCEAAGETPSTDRQLLAANKLIPRKIVVLRVKGLVGCSSSRPSELPCAASYYSSACSSTSTTRAVSVASSAGRSYGTSAPALRATAAISGSSVETRMSHTSGMPFTASTGHAIYGLLPSSRFFLAIR